MSTEILHYVPYEDLDKYLKQGWINLGPAPAHHAWYGVIMIWPFEGEPPGEC